VPSVVATLEACIPALRRYAATLLRDQHEADTLVHDCLTLALHKLHTRRNNDDTRAWTFAILHNLFMSRTRRCRAQRRSMKAVGEACIGAGAGKDDIAESGVVKRAFNSLPEEQRSALFLVSVEELPYAVAAKALGIPLTTMMSRLALGREQLRQFMNIEELSRKLEDGANSSLRENVRSGRQTSSGAADSVRKRRPL
jgi:RNA polymerase sigma-70 factor, ECF subfamily